MNPARELLQLRRNPGDGGDELRNPLLQRQKVGRHVRLNIAQFEAKRNQALLRTVVQIAFDTPSRVVSGLRRCGHVTR